jgi:CAAX protease family protein
LTIVPFALGVFVHGPFPAELGWRGYVLDRLQSRWNVVVSSLILGAIWALWHLPLFFIKDMIHCAQGVWSPWFWQFMLGVIPVDAYSTTLAAAHWQQSFFISWPI